MANATFIEYKVLHKINVKTTLIFLFYLLQCAKFPAFITTYGQILMALQIVHVKIFF